MFGKEKIQFETLCWLIETKTMLALCAADYQALIEDFTTAIREDAGYVRFGQSAARPLTPAAYPD